MTAYYNEHDPKAAAWLRELIKQGHIAPGEVDERSIENVTPDELAGFTQCHFFAGIGVWSYALRQAGWPDDRPVWTGSCPCQSFSAAGAGKGFADERHLWPAWFHLISQCRPRTIFGEQVEAAIRHGWLDLVQSDLEGVGYACGAVPFPACGIGAPHIRQRLYFVANANDARPQGRGILPECADQFAAGAGGVARIMAHATVIGRIGRRAGEAGVEPGKIERPERLCDAGGMADANPERCAIDARLREEQIDHPETCGHGETCHRPGPTNGFWRDADWLHCTDGKWRAVEPGTQPLAHGAPARVGRLRGYGNAIVAEQAKAFVKVYLEC